MKNEYNTTNPEEERPDSFPQRMRYSTLYQLFKLSTSEHRGIIRDEQDIILAGYPYTKYPASNRFP